MQRINEILDAKLIEHHKHQKKRNYLGVSSIGDDCLRKVQLQYEGNEAVFTASTSRTFDIGHCLEDLVAQWLKIAGFDLKTRNENGEQFGFSVADGKLQGHVDGIIHSFPEEIAPQQNIGCRDHPCLWECKTMNNKSWSDTAKRGVLVTKPSCLWECKTMNNKSWSDTAKRGVLVTKPLYYSQIQLYMAYLELDQCLFTALNKDTSELYFELVPFDSEAAQRYSDRAAQIIKASENNELMPCVSSDPSFFKCKMCGFKDVCRAKEN